MEITVLFFGPLRGIFGEAKKMVEVQEASEVQHVVAQLLEDAQFAKAKDLKLAFAVEGEIVPAQTVLNDGDTLALLPPVAGG